MKHSWRIGKISGIDIFIDSSWIIIFVLFTWVLSVTHFPQHYPGWPVRLYWLVGVTTSLLIFISVLIHELAHSLIALRQGEKVRNITLFILGGVAQISEEPKSPLRELTLALSGPVSSLLLALFFLFISFVFKGVSIPLYASASYLTLINTILALFNMLPGFPMDGGRVLRSVIWKLSGDLRKATRIASRTGQGLAFFIIFLGLIQILRSNFSGFWLIFIGWFLHSASIRGYNQVMVEAMLKGVKASDLMNRDFETVSSNLSVQALVDDYILKKRERAFLVSDNGKLKGIVCLEDVKKTPRERWMETSVEEIMVPKEELEYVSPDSDGNRVLQRITAKDVHQVPVLEGDRITGIVCRSDILRYLHLRSELGI